MCLLTAVQALYVRTYVCRKETVQDCVKGQSSTACIGQANNVLMDPANNLLMDQANNLWMDPANNVWMDQGSNVWMANMHAKGPFCSQHYEKYVDQLKAVRWDRSTHGFVHANQCRIVLQCSVACNYLHQRVEQLLHTYSDIDGVWPITASWRPEASLAGRSAPRTELATQRCELHAQLSTQIFKSFCMARDCMTINRKGTGSSVHRFN